MGNIILKNYDKNYNEIKEIKLESKIIFNALDYYKILFNQEIAKNEFEVSENSYVRGFGNIDGKVFIAYYKSYDEELCKIAYNIYDYMENLRSIAEEIDRKY